MHLPPSRRARTSGVALLLVMCVVFVLTVLALAFSTSMKTEAVLAQNFNNDAQLDWAGRSGVEYARWMLSLSLSTTDGRRCDALNQAWAGGTGDYTNDLAAELFLPTIPLDADGQVVFRRPLIVDQERFFNINGVDPLVLQRALTLMGVDASLHGLITDSIKDWTDRDDDPGINGAESDDYYLRQPVPYWARNGPIDDISELALVKGVSADLYSGAGHSNVFNSVYDASARLPGMSGTGAVGLTNLFTAVSAGRVNVNTCSAEVLQILGLDPTMAQVIIDTRRGPDGLDGTEDDLPYQVAPSTGQQQDPAAQAALSQLSVRSAIFEVIVTCDVGGYVRQYRALLRRNNQRDVPILYMHPL